MLSIHMATKNADFPNFPFLDNLNIDQDVKSRLSVNLARTYSGNSDVLMTPMAREHSAERILSEWDKVFQGNKKLMNDTLINLEESQRSKFGPRSISLNWKDRRHMVLEYFERSNLKASNLTLQPVTTLRIGLRPISVSKAMNILKNSTNSGLPFYIRKSLVKERVLKRFPLYLDRKDPCILFTRTQEQLKTRTVWGYPIADSLNEMTYYSPLLNYQKSLHWRSALRGPDEVNKSLTKIIRTAKSKGMVLVSIDFSAYDSSIDPSLITAACEYCKILFQDQFHPGLDYITDRIINIGLVTPEGIMNGPHGIPSGSTFTNEYDSIIQYLIAVKSNAIEEELFDIQGDDGVYAIMEEKVTSLFNTFKSFGLNVNVDKSYQSPDYLIYLQNLYHIDYLKDGVIGGIYPTYRALCRICYQERWSNFEEYGIKGSDYYAIRAITIMENCKFHPLFEELVRLVLKYDKYRLQTSQMGIRQYIQMITDTSGTEGILINHYGDDIKGIERFETVKLLKRLV